MNATATRALLLAAVLALGGIGLLVLVLRASGRTPVLAREGIITPDRDLRSGAPRPPEQRVANPREQEPELPSAAEATTGDGGGPASLAALRLQRDALRREMDQWVSDALDRRFAAGSYEVLGEDTEAANTDEFIGIRTLPSGEMRQARLPRAEYPRAYDLRARWQAVCERLATLEAESPKLE